jgi:hypothetical protein
MNERPGGRESEPWARAARRVRVTGDTQERMTTPRSPGGPLRSSMSGQQ